MARVKATKRRRNGGAISHLEAALRLVGDNALVYQGLGEAYFQYVNIGGASGRE